MQESPNADHEAAGGAGADEAERLLETPDGTWLVNEGLVIGRVHGRKAAFEYKSIEWHPIVALKILQGMPVPQATGLTLVAGRHRPVYHPRPGVDGPRFSIGT